MLVQSNLLQILAGRYIAGGQADAGLYVEQLAHRLANGLVEVYQPLPAVLSEEGAQVVFVVLEEGRVAVGRLQGLPVQMAPVAVVGKQWVACRGCVLDGHGEGLHALSGRDETAVAVGLLLKRLVLLYQHARVATEFLVPLNGTEIGGGEEGSRQGSGARYALVKSEK